MKVLICKDNLTNTLISTQLLPETDNIKYIIVDNAPIIEAKEGYIGKYVLDTDGNITVEYTEIPKSEVELLKEENEQLQERMATAQEMISSLTEMCMTSESTGEN